ncbi:MAG: isoprenylcysteine carboxylmethyltransferase family protein [Casimicrobiaceae bacterium]
MKNPDLLIYAVHAAFWCCFGLTRLLVREPTHSPTGGAASTPVAKRVETAAFSRLVLAFHMLAFGIMYFGIGAAVFPHRVPEWFTGQRIVGTCVIATGAALAAWALVHFRSWRLRAKLDQGHELATGGPFRLLRHPIYMGLNLLALGTAIWIPTVVEWLALGLMVIGSDLRARSEEAILVKAFGNAYTTYCARTKRFIPLIY